ncbi:ATP-binding protein, partial [Acinetobacter baumannii]
DGTVRVLDDGPGVPAEERESVFTRFWRRDRSRADSRGLGLAIVARVAAAHEGAVSVDNRPEGGAVFTLRLRLA